MNMVAQSFAVRSWDGIEGAEIHVGYDVQQYTTDWHVHSDWQFIHLIEGERELSWRGGTTRLGVGETLVIPPTVVHRGAAPSRCSFVMVYLPASLMPAVEDDAQVALATVTGLDLIARGKCADWESLMSDLFATASAVAAYGNRSRDGVRARIARVAAMNLIDGTDRLSFEQMGQFVERSPFYVAHLFREHFGISQRRFDVQVKLNRARKRLLRGDRPATAAAESGFADQSHMGRHFKRAFGISPGQFARAIAISEEKRRIRGLG